MILRGADLARFEDAEEACWVQDVRVARVVWANAAALVCLRAASLEELRARDISPRSEAARTRLATYLTRVADGGTFRTQWTTFSAGVPITFLADVRGFELDDGARALFFSARRIDDAVCAEGLRLLEAARHSVACYALFRLSGELLEHNPAFVREFPQAAHAGGDAFLGLFADAEEGERVRSEIVTKARFRGRVRVGEARGWHMLLALTIPDPVDGERVIHAELIEIGDQVEAEERARAAEKLLEGGTDEFPHPMGFVRADKTFGFVNRTYCAWAGLPRERIIGQPIRAVAGAEIDEIWDRHWPALARGQRASFERLSRFRTHGERWMSWDLVPHAGERGEVEGAFVFGYDVTALKLAESGLRTNERQMAMLADSLPVGVALVDAAMQVRFVNATFCRWHGVRGEAVLGRHVAEIIGEPAFEETREARARALAGETVQIRRGALFEGRERQLDITMAPVREAEGRVDGIIAVYNDVTERVESRQALNRVRDTLASHIANTPLAVVQLDRDRRITQWTGRAPAVFGWSEAEAVGKRMEELRLLDAEEMPAFEHELQVLDEERSERFTAAFRSLRNDGSTLHGEWSVSVLRAGGRVDSYLLLVQDVTAKVSAERDLAYLADHDALTGLANRRQFQQRLGTEMARARRLGSRLAVLVVDIDRFRYVNESLGHAAGDALLQQVALRLRAAAREGELIARTGADEFMLMADLMGEPQRALAAAQAVRSLLAAPFQLDGQELFMTASIGAAVFPDDATAEPDVIRNADWALDCAKRSGRNAIQFFSAVVAEGRPPRLIVEADLRRALDRAQLELLYQPKRSIAGGQVTGVEALLRWRHPEQGVVTPDQFIALAEDSGLIVDIGRWVIGEACRQMADWRGDGRQVPQVAVNISAVQLRRRELAGEVLDCLGRHALTGGSLMVEVTESSVVSDPLLAAASLEALREAGVQSAIDDFGTGFSSLSQLKRLPIDALKVDGSFVRDVTVDRENAAIVQAIIGLARTLDMNVIAEGVETSEQLAFLSRHGCDEAQGYLISEPLAGALLAERFLDRASKVASVS